MLIILQIQQNTIHLKIIDINVTNNMNILNINNILIRT